MEINTIYNDNCMTGMKNIPNETIDLIVTDPPYKLTSRGSSGTMSGYWATDIARKGKVFKHNDIDIEEYIQDFYRILKPDTHCYIMCNHLNLTHFLQVIDNSKFHFVKCLIWDKMNKITGKYYMNQFEYILFLRKGKDRPINDCGTSDIISILNRKPKDKQGKNIHDSAKPVQLFQILIKNSSQKGDLIFDPFMGSGTTALAALRTGRNYIGYEIDKGYYEKAVTRINNEQKQLTFNF